jgi:Iron-sulfur cluster-binding domain
VESIYYSITWACHRKCKHCYEDRFRPYLRTQLATIVNRSKEAFPRIVDNFPDRMTYLDFDTPTTDAAFAERTGRIILSGGEVLLDAIREPVLYPLLERLRNKYRDAGGAKVVIQTTGDLVTEKIIDQLLSRNVWMISVAGMDDFHIGMEGGKREPLKARLSRWFESAGMRPGPNPPVRKGYEDDGPLFTFFGATPDAWIGKLWPRGRAWTNDLSTAELGDNFCNRWSGGLNFLNHRYSGSEVAVDADGDVYPCCMKTKLAIGNLTEEPLIEILDSLVGHPVYEAINMGHPERMGLAYGWDLDRFLSHCEITTPKGRHYRNLCIGCDRFHEQILAPIIARIRDERRAKRRAIAAE